MKIEDVEKIEQKLKDKGYRKFTQCLSSQEDWGWFKTLRDGNGEEKVIIEIRFWDFRKYGHFNEEDKEVGIDVLFIYDDRIYRMDNVLNGLGEEYYKNLNVENVEEIARHYFKYCEKITKIINNSYERV